MKFLIAFTLIALMGPPSFAKTLPDTGCGGDLRRDLTTPFRDLNAPVIPASEIGLSGSYIGLYDIKCFGIDGNYRMCNFSRSRGGARESVVGSIAIVLGNALADVIVGKNPANSAITYLIDTSLAACNTVGDHCEVRGIRINEL